MVEYYVEPIHEHKGDYLSHRYMEDMGLGVNYYCCMACHRTMIYKKIKSLKHLKVCVKINIYRERASLHIGEPVKDFLVWSPVGQEIRLLARFLQKSEFFLFAIHDSQVNPFIHVALSGSGLAVDSMGNIPLQSPHRYLASYNDVMVLYPRM